jgi:acetyl-CoA carboxylase/biotin carboxylase 1
MSIRHHLDLNDDGGHRTPNPCERSATSIPVVEWDFVLRHDVIKGSRMPGGSTLTSPVNPLPKHKMGALGALSSSALGSYVDVREAATATSGASATLKAGTVTETLGDNTTSGSSNQSGSHSRSPTSPTVGAIIDEQTARLGFMMPFESVAQVEALLPDVLKQRVTSAQSSGNDPASPVSASSRGQVVVNVVLPLSDASAEQSDEKVVESVSGIPKRMSALLRDLNVRRVTFLFVRMNQFPLFFTFRKDIDYGEDLVIRHIEPAMAYQLELRRMANFNIQPCFVDSRKIHVYHAVAKQNPSDARFFVRALVYPGQMSENVSTKEYLTSEGHRTMTTIMDALEMARTTEQNYDCNHLFINFVPTFILRVTEVEDAIRDFIERHGLRLFKLRVTHAEIRFLIQATPHAEPQPYRFTITNVSGFVTKIETYMEVRDPINGQYVLRSVRDPPESFNNTPVFAPYTTKESIQPKRYKAHLMGTTYVYDFPDVFATVIERIWKDYAVKAGRTVTIPTSFMKYVELVLNDSGTLQKVERLPGKRLNSLFAVYCWH